MYRDFTGHTSDKIIEVPIKGNKTKVGLTFGICDGFGVEFKGKVYDITFNKKPLICTDYNGKNLELLDGDKLSKDLTNCKVTYILYTTKRDYNTEYYKHDFKKTARPKLAIFGKQIQLIGKKYTFTDRGIVDH